MHKFLATFAMKCSSFTPVNAGTSGRSACASLGREGIESVETSNKLLCRTVFLCMVTTCLGGCWVLEQPGGSCLQFFPAWRDLCANLMRASGAEAVWRTTWHMFHYGGKTPKPHYAYSNSEFIGRLWKGKLTGWKKRALEDGHVQTCEVYQNKDGKTCYKGTKRLRSTEEYPEMFGMALVDLYTDLTDSPCGTARLPKRVPPAFESFKKMPDSHEGLRFAALGEVYSYLRGNRHLVIPSEWRPFVICLFSLHMGDVSRLVLQEMEQKLQLVQSSTLNPVPPAASPLAPTPEQPASAEPAPHEVETLPAPWCTQTPAKATEEELRLSAATGSAVPSGGDDASQVQPKSLETPDTPQGKRQPTRQERLRAAAKARLRRLCQEKKKRKNMEVPKWVRDEYETRCKNDLAQLLMNCQKGYTYEASMLRDVDSAESSSYLPKSESQAPAIADGAFDGLADMAARQAADAAVKEKHVVKLETQLTKMDEQYDLCNGAMAQGEVHGYNAKCSAACALEMNAKKYEKKDMDGGADAADKRAKGKPGCRNVRKGGDTASSCRAAIRGARGVVRDIGAKAAAKSKGLNELARCTPEHSERDFQNVAERFQLQLPGRGRKKAAFLVMAYHSYLGRGTDSANKTRKEKPYLSFRLNYGGNSHTHRMLTAVLPRMVRDTVAFDDLLTFVKADALQALKDGVVASSGEKYHAVVLQVLGDWMFLAKAGSLARSFANVEKRPRAAASQPKGICHLCQAGQLRVPFEDLRPEPGWANTLFLAGDVPFNSRPVLLDLPHEIGKSPGFFAYDVWHAFHLGVGKTFTAAVLAMISLQMQGSNVDQRFAELTKCYLDYCESSHSSPFLTIITNQTLGWGDLQTYPNGQWSKGHITVLMMEFIVDWFLKNGTAGDPLFPLAEQAARHVNGFMKSLYSSDLWIESSRAMQIAQMGFAFLVSYMQLAKQAFQAGRSLFIFMPKVHVVHHVVHSMQQDACAAPMVLNPLSHGVQVDEDYVGRISRISRRVSPQQAITRTLQRALKASRWHYVQEGYLRG
ncbi:Uncharacterized protein SCF082_LOCUS7912 [Durusdinium trenchii]|uniref:Uncharacterized protein n=1 Tax=Durusdinium trenchii TaxID=1381693 RepID=A0ABP0IMH7_9DINO